MKRWQATTIFLKLFLAFCQFFSPFFSKVVTRRHTGPNSVFALPKLRCPSKAIAECGRRALGFSRRSAHLIAAKWLLLNRLSGVIR